MSELNSTLLMLRCEPEASLEARVPVVRPSRPRFAGHLRMRSAARGRTLQTP
jgi:hypothetical protein